MKLNDHSEMESEGDAVILMFATSNTGESVLGKRMFLEASILSQDR